MAELKDRRQREERISRELSVNGSVSVCNLSRELGVSEVTIRKDLVSMEHRGLLKRVSGGAVMI